MMMRPMILFSLISLACSGSAEHKKSLTFCDDDLISVNKDSSPIQILEIVNKSGYTLVARIEGFGIENTNGRKRSYEFKTGGVTIENGATRYLHRPCDSGTTEYHLYTSVLMIRIKNYSDAYGDINSEAAFLDPFKGKRLIINWQEDQKQKMAISMDKN